MMPNKIGVIDSGIGGLNILKKLLKERPNNNYIYYGDTIHLPYGEKTPEELLIYSSKIIEFLIKKGVSTIVIACGTLCSTIYQQLKEKFQNIRLVNIVDLTCDYINKSNYNKIGLIATNNTINSHAFKKKILTKEVIEIATPEFVPILENRLKEKYDYYIDYYLKKIPDIDALILGCTHYILLKDKITNYLCKPVINMADYVVKEVSNESEPSLVMYFSKIDEKLKENIKEIIGTSNVILKKLD